MAIKAEKIGDFGTEDVTNQNIGIKDDGFGRIAHLACGEGAVSLLPQVFELAEEFIFADVVGLEEVAEVLGGFVELDQGDEVLDPVVVGWGRAG